MDDKMAQALRQPSGQAEGRLDRPSKAALSRAYDILLEHRAGRLAAEKQARKEAESHDSVTPASGSAG